MQTGSENHQNMTPFIQGGLDAKNEINKQNPTLKPRITNGWWEQAEGCWSAQRWKIFVIGLVLYIFIWEGLYPHRKNEFSIKTQKPLPKIPPFSQNRHSQYSIQQRPQPCYTFCPFPWGILAQIDFKAFDSQQILKIIKKGNLMFGFTATHGAPLYLYFLPAGYCLPPPATPSSHSEKPTLQNPIYHTTDPLLSDEIILTRHDLLQEGYEQSRRPWSKEEDRLLLRLCRDEQARFEEIAQQIQGRNAKMCYSRFRRLSYQTKTIWTQEEDEKLLALVEEHGEDQWKRFEPLFKGRTHKQIRDHFENHLKPDVNRSEWSVDQDLLLIALINTHGRNWKEIEDRLPGRGRNQIKNRFFGKICRLNARKRVQLQKVETSQN